MCMSCLSIMEKRCFFRLKQNTKKTYDLYYCIISSIRLCVFHQQLLHIIYIYAYIHFFLSFVPVSFFFFYLSNNIISSAWSLSIIQQLQSLCANKKTKKVSKLSYLNVESEGLTKKYVILFDKNKSITQVSRTSTKAIVCIHTFDANHLFMFSN